MNKRAAVFSCLGLGDGLISLVLSNNLKLNGFDVTTYHPSLASLQKWFPGLPILPFPSLGELARFDSLFLFFEKSLQMQAVIQECQAHFPERTRILNPIATSNRDYPFWEGGRFDGRTPFAENLVRFCKERLGFSRLTKECGIVVPEGVAKRAFPRRVVIHPAGSRLGKEWLPKRYDELAAVLQARGWEPAFVMSPNERAPWLHQQPPALASLGDLAAFVASSSAMIGNDSGVGHLASALGLPTLTLCRSKQAGAFWRPCWSRGFVLYPPSYIPNLKGVRLRDRYWKELISVRRVLNAFLELLTRA
ncbi:MAG TPA: hypothetical protein DCY54_06535 [Parachlamydiales bacterium]|nr:MAG: hypothetical protein A3D18_05165 [Chlamydiae bacterium RIFCSPHIGHO2_02_FULL_49_29]OGN64344.1 MAG: hypothetical protein A3E26_05065 [Chlamydiae bacterium RIFCSPHIGHO2_12_FULL_49_32]OGN67903.1 MAG: hypothetical protein A3I15_04585 [Chlamydiae bacterium RIFCSPLOWO2_02_FULL_49_12]OGN71907.1 MAG: hypothetical protein A3G30_00560 [Chlamydiae bacterium RIFCSPLOWO2_12_FULL_49_12]HAZ16267.1 hypothetical protein [Parachlamydiales bacterium]